MAVTCNTVAVPSSGTVSVFSSTPSNSNSISVRNTGTTTVYLGSAGSILFPLAANEFLGLAVANDDNLLATGNGNAGTLVVLGVG